MCPVAWCSTLVSPGHVSCRWHWRRVPQELRDPLIERFRQRESDPIDHQLACDQARQLVIEYSMAPMRRDEQRATGVAGAHVDELALPS
jgi:hypothetical protein